MRKLIKTVSLLLVLIIIFGAVDPLNTFAEEPNASNTVTIDPFRNDYTYGDFADYIDIVTKKNGEKVTDIHASYTKDDLSAGLLVKRGKKNFRKVTM